MSAPDAELGLEAAEWLLRLTDPEPAAQEREAFLDWVGQSPGHLRVFLETVETHRRLMGIEREHLRTLDELLGHQRADVVSLYGHGHRSVVTEPTRNPRLRYIGLAAAIATMCVAALSYWLVSRSDSYRTSVGEQRSAKLEDGSFIYLNTDSSVEVDFSETARDIRLVRGEALFVVERDSTRPFTVHAGTATIRAIGTQFNVRRLDERTEVAVVEGVVQVAETSAQLKAGERVAVARGGVTPPHDASVADALAWRQRRLVFHDAKLSDVAAEFNRYNRTKIRVEGTASDIELTGIFDADRPQALMLYAAGSDALIVEPNGDDWVIRGR
jgi:transmembrane sensor